MQSCRQFLVKGFQARNEELHILALQSFEQALRTEPEDDAIRLEVARSQLDAGMFSEGRKTLLAIPCDGIDDGEFLLDLGRVWMIAGETERALSYYSMIKPEHDEFQEALLEGVTLLERSQGKDEVPKWLESFNVPPNDHPHAQLAHAIGASCLGDDEQAMARYEQIWKADKNSHLGIEAGYRLARIYARADMTPEGLEILKVCKAMESKQMPGKKLQKVIQRRRSYDWGLLSCISEDWFSDRKEISKAENMMILGHPRSGTSLIAKRLAGASGACWVDEPQVFEIMGQQWVQGKKSAAKPRGMCQLLHALSKEDSSDFFAKYRKQLNSYTQQATMPSRWIDKNPGLTASLVTLHKLLPEVAWLMVLRDPRDIAMSCYFQRFGPTQLGWACQTPEGAMSAVTHVLEIWTEVSHRLTEKNHLSIKYEDFVADEKAAISQITDAFDWMDDHQPKGDEHSVGPRINMTPSYSDIHQSTYRSACGRWKTADDLFSLRGATGRRLLDELGYEL